MRKEGTFRDNLDGTIKNVYREENKITQKFLASQIGTTNHNIEKWENGKAEPSIENLQKLADYFHITVDELVGHPVSDNDGITSEEKLIIEKYRTMDSSQKKSFRQFIVLLEKKNVK